MSPKALAVALSVTVLAGNAVVIAVFVIVGLAVTSAGNGRLAPLTAAFYFSILCAGPVAVANVMAQLAPWRYSRWVTYATVLSAAITTVLFVRYLLPIP